MKFSLWPDPARPTDEVLDLARLADDDGWFGFWYADHFMPNTGSEELKAGDTHECWSILPAVAAITSKVRLGPLVSPTSVHHPALLANRAATIDHLSNGRMVLGLGAGWQINEHHAYGIDLEPAGQRVSRFAEAIEITRSLLDDEHTSFDGEFYKFIEAPCDPKPIQAKLPILVGTGSPRMLRITARHAQEWNTWGAPGLAAERREAFVEACLAVGTDPASIHTSVQALVFMTDDEQALAGIRSGEMADRSISGSNDELATQIEAYAELGYDEVIIPDFTLGETREARFDAFRQFNEEVAPQFS